MKKLFISMESTTGTVYDRMRLLAADRVKAQKIARMNNIPWDNGPECETLLCFTLSQRTGALPAPDLDTFLENLADWQITFEDVSDDPTRGAPATSSMP